MATTNISIRMDSDLKAQADALFGELGMNRRSISSSANLSGTVAFLLKSR